MPLPPLYAILDVDVTAAHGWAPADVCTAWLDAGIRLIQLRAKSLSLGPFVEMADHITGLCHQAGAQCIINDRADVAVLCAADGVHVGQADLAPVDVRTIVGISAIVGLSTHDDAQVMDALKQPVSYVATGPVFGTRTKETGYQPVGLTQVQATSRLAHAAGVPVVAIGGITLERATEVLAAGADSVAVVSALLPDGGRTANGNLASLGRCARAWVEAL